MKSNKLHALMPSLKLKKLRLKRNAKICTELLMKRKQVGKEKSTLF